MEENLTVMESVSHINLNFTTSESVESPGNKQQTYVVSLEHVNGLSQMVRLTGEEIEKLGLTVGDYDQNDVNKITDDVFMIDKTDTDDTVINNKDSDESAIAQGEDELVGSSENPIEIIHSDGTIKSAQNLSQDYLREIVEALKNKPEKKEKPSNLVYRVVYPEELNLKALKANKAERGRPKKRILQEPPARKPAPELIVKIARTRSGRITRPPRHISKDFKQNDASDNEDAETDVKPTETEALVTSESNEKTDLVHSKVELVALPPLTRKHPHPAQFRCPTCKKVYLGRSRMLKHLKQNASHGPPPQQGKCKVWDCLIDVSLKHPVGTRGLRFCEEITRFLHNARAIASLLFKKPTQHDKDLFYVDDTLASIFDVSVGQYVLNDSAIFKEVSVLAFLAENSFDLLPRETENGNQIHGSKSLLVGNGNEHFSSVNNKTLSLENENVPNYVACDTGQRYDQNRLLNSQDNINCRDSTLTLNSVDDNGQNSFFLGHAMHNSGTNLQVGDTFRSNDHDSDCNNPNSLFAVDSQNQDKVDNFKFDEEFIAQINDSLNEKKDCLNLHSGSIDSTCDNRDSYVINKREGCDLANQITLHNELSSDSSLLNSLPNLRASPDGLILPNVDTTQVSGLLDNSTSSDEILNVDQFVNERLKNLTGPDLDLSWI